MSIRDSLCHEFLNKCVGYESLRFEFVTDTSPGDLDAAGGVGLQTGVGVWDGHGEVGIGEGSGEEERSPSS